MAYAEYATYVSLETPGATVGHVHCDSYSDARAHLKELLDAAERGQLATVRRNSFTTAVVDVGRLRHFLTALIPSRAQVVPEAEGWSIFVPGVPVAADGGTFSEAIDEMVQALREYADDWQDHLVNAPNHEKHWGLVQMIALSSDEQLRDWLTGPS